MINYIYSNSAILSLLIVGANMRHFTTLLTLNESNLWIFNLQWMHRTREYRLIICDLAGDEIFNSDEHSHIHSQFNSLELKNNGFLSIVKIVNLLKDLHADICGLIEYE